jgi:D-alanyl-D-alanine carboxypeptidase
VVKPSNSLPTSSAVQPAQQSVDWKLVLVNFDNKMPDNFQNIIVNKFNVTMDSRIVTPYQKMRDAAEKDKIHIWISSGFRNSATQQQLFTEEIQSFSRTGLSYNDAVNKAAKSVARPGYSEHNTGLAIDINGVLDNFDGSPAFKWMQKHAQEYGFVLRYQKDKQDITKIKYEPWHYRYVGVENAKKMNELNMCLEEYVAYLKKNSTASN